MRRLLAWLEAWHRFWTVRYTTKHHRPQEPS